MKKVLFILLLLISSVGIFFIIGLLDKEESVKVKLSMEASVFKDVYFMQKKDGDLKLKLYAKEALMNEDAKTLELKSLSMFFPEKEFTVKAKKGIYSTDSGDILLREEVEGYSKDLTVYGSEAQWNGKEKMLISDKPLKIQGNRFIIEGNAGIAKADLIELREGVRAIVYSKK